MGELMALGAALTWSTSVILFKRSEAMDPRAMNLVKNLLSLLLMGLTLLVMGGGIDLQRPAVDWYRIVASGVLGLFIGDILVFAALRRLGAASFAVIDCSYAPLMVALSTLVLGERPGGAFLAGAALVVTGVLLAHLDGFGRRSSGEREAGGGEGRRQHLTGVLLGLGGIASMVVGVVLVKPALSGASLVEVTLLRLAAGVAAQVSWATARRRRRRALRASLRPNAAWRTLIPATILGSYVAMLLWLGGFKYTDASVAGVLNQTSSAFVVLQARLVLGEAVGLYRGLGAFLAMAGAMLVVAL